LAGADLNADNVYDFDLEQWDLEREPGESFITYANRVGNSRVWATEDYSGHDVTPEAARDWNQTEPDSKNVYYFSVTTKHSSPGLLTGWEYPRLTMFPVLIPVAYPVPIIMGLGNYTQNVPGKVVIDAKWWPNDGAANTYGMSGPNTSIIKPYTGAPEKGVWNHIGVYNGYDHFAIIGMGVLPYNVRPFYMNIASLLAAVE
jgi:triacylglycerol lipase